MIETILTALGVYISTSIDYLFILLIMFTQLTDTSQKKHIYAGKYLGTGVLVGVSLIAAYIMGFVPEDWIIGLLGLVPIFLGIRYALVGEEEPDEDEIRKQMTQRDSTQLFWTITLLTIASGGDNLGIYIPYFSALNAPQIIVALIVFALGIIGLVEISRVLAKLPYLAETIEKYEGFIIPIVFIGLGLYIMIENGTLHHLYHILF